ncbi:Melatonin receptor type 1A [Acropora cervicornis]|uniref:Melatonin receptor type 1A n=1 Tax=Acropora cervicornis TaxID=6130 RepID=A0AAD9V3J0_ACRCE|nr:Melatonin receptor type 1A [Acropora cervicornis]
MPPFLEPRDTGIVIVESSTLLFLNVVSLLGNALICLAVYRKPQLRTTTNLFIVALAVCDLSSAVFVMPFSSAVLIKGEWIFGDVLCSVQGFFTVLNIYASPCLITLTAFNRYVRIVKTKMYNKLFSMGKCQLWICSVYVVVTTYIVTQVVVGNQKIQFVPGYAVCTSTHLREAAKVIHYSFVVPVFVVGPIVITTICCCRIFKTIRRHNNVLAVKDKSKHEGGRKNEACLDSAVITLIECYN